MRTLVTGATGFIGRHLLPHLKRPVVLSRPGSKGRGPLNVFDLTAYDWSPSVGPPPAQAFDGVDVVYHLAGEPVVGGRWNRAKKRRIFASRVTGTTHLVKSLAQLARPPRLLISASAVGYYGSCGDAMITESEPPGHDFLADLCVAWEAAATAAAAAGIRVVLPRIAPVLGRDGGALAKMLGPFRWGLGGRLGSGRQWMPWIHIDDLVQLFLFLESHETLSGPVNASAPQPVTNADFTAALGQALHRPTIVPVPKSLLRLVLGEAAQVLLASQRVVPNVASRAGFEFQYRLLDEALKQILSP